MKRLLTALCLAALAGLPSLAPAAHATNVAVVRVGDGASALTSAATPVFVELREGSSGAGLGTTALPTAAVGANAPLTMSGTSTTEGGITRSVDGYYLVLGGYTAVPGTASVNTTSAASVPRVVGRLDAAGIVDTSTTLGTSAYTTTSIRDAATIDGSEFWTSGNGGVFYAPLGLGATSVATDNTRRIAIFAGQLYATAASGSVFGPATVGSGLPTSGPQTLTLLPGFPTSAASPIDFVAFDLSGAVAGIDRIYVADDRAVASGGGIQKWTFDGVNWTLVTTFSNGLTAGARGLTGEAGANGVRLWATTAETPTRLVTMLDDDVIANPALTPLAVAATNTVFRGVALAPNPPSVALSAATYTVDEGVGVLTVTAHRGGPIEDTLDVSYQTADGTATSAAEDYIPTSGVLHFPSGHADATFNVPIINDGLVEGGETFTVTLSNPSAPTVLGDPPTATATITDNDVPASGGGGTGGSGTGGTSTTTVPPATTTTTATTTPPGTQPPAATTIPGPQLVVLGRPRVRGRVVTTGVGLKCPATQALGPCAGTVVAKSKGKTVAKGTVSVAAGSTGAIKVRLTRAGLAKLKRARRLKVALTVVVPYGGETVRRTITITLRAPTS